MAQKIERVYRDRKLTDEEAAKYTELRRRIEEEFPPLEPRPRIVDGPFSQTLRRAILESGRSVEEIGREAGLPPALIERYLSGEQDLRMETADRLAQTLGLHLAVVP